LPLYDGELGVAKNHSPMIGRLGFGELRIKGDGEQVRYYIDGGFVQVANNIVTVLTNRALRADQIDTQAADAQLSSAVARRVSGDEALAIRDRLIAQARGQLRVRR
jgi:F-type H+-transporting ATPase subunit epsilon